MSEPEAPTPPADRNPYATPTSTPPSYTEHRAALARQPFPQYTAYGGQPYGPPSPWPVQPRPEHQPGTNRMAAAALVFGIIGGIPLAIIFGVIALGQTANGRQQGRGLAIAGLICAGLWLAGIGTAGVYAAVTAPERDDAGQITDEGSVSTFAVEIGDCLNGLREVEDAAGVASLPAVPCAEAHEGEVFASFELEAGAYPGIDGITAQADAQCSAALLTYSPSAYENPGIGMSFLYPQEPSWPREREVVCIAVALEGTLTGSLADRPGV